KALPLNEWVSRCCRARTLPHRPACVACTIRAWSRRTSRSTCRQGMVCQSVGLWGAAPGAMPAPAFGAVVFVAPVICFAPLAGSPSSLVLRAQMEVCPLSREVMSPIGSTSVPTIAVRHSLFPSSSTRYSIGGLYRPLSRWGEQRAYHVPYTYLMG